MFCLPSVGMQEIYPQVLRVKASVGLIIRQLGRSEVGSRSFGGILRHEGLVGVRFKGSHARLGMPEREKQREFP